MAYDYDADILGVLWTGAEDGVEPYASFIAANPTLTDEVSENRILSTIELLRSHMELLQTRDEAKLLHESISKLITHTAGGSNPFSPAAAITNTVGNVPGPTFPAGASIDITIDGVTSSPVSASGGDCATVAAELNITLDASIPGDTEQTTIDGETATSAGLSGTYFNINSANDATPYYVWFDFPGEAEVFTVTPNGDTDGSLGETYFDFNRADGPGVSDFYIWLSHDGRAEVTSVTVPAPGDTDGDLGETHFTMETAAAAQFYLWLSHDGRSESVSLDFTAITGATLPTGAVAAAFFDVTSTTTTYRFWFDDTSTTPPAVTTETLVAIAFVGGDTDVTLTAKVLPVVSGADLDFAGFTSPTATTITGTLATVGNVTDPIDGPGVLTGATIGSTVQGLAAAESAPGAEGTGIEAAYTVGDDAATVAGIARTAIGLNVNFGTDGANPFTFNNVVNGDTNNSADVDTGFTISTTVQGIDAAELDPAAEGTGVEAPYTVGAIASVIGDAIRVAASSIADVSAEGNDPVTVTMNNIGDVGDVSDGTAGTGFGFSVTNQGIDASTDPAPVGRTGIPVAVAAGLSDGEIGFALRAAVGANPDFSTEGAGFDSEINTVVNGVATDSADVDTGFTSITTTRQGVDDIGDAVAVQAFCQLPGPRLGFRGQEDFVTFDLSNGTGGIIGPAGIIPGPRLSTPKKVADRGRNNALGNFAGARRPNPLTP
jgi:hypothetical protein